jgi:hypothetical protein
MKLIDAALAYAADGWKIFPIVPLTKDQPMVKWGLESTTDLDVIRKFWTRHPTANIGFASGQSGVFVIDVDIKDGGNGQRTLDMLELELGYKLSLTRIQKTPSGGLQFFFQGDGPTTQNVIGASLYAGTDVSNIDTRGTGGNYGGYVLLPPSHTVENAAHHTKTGVYEWLNGAAHPLAPIDAWVAEMCSAGAARKTERNDNSAKPVITLDQDANEKWAIHYLQNDAPHSIWGRGGEHTLLLVAATLKDKGLSEDLARTLIEEYYNVPFICEPVWQFDGPDGDSLKNKISNAYHYCTYLPPGSDTPEANFGGVNELSPEEKAAFAESETAFPQGEPVKELSDDPYQIVRREWVYVKNSKLFVKLTNFDFMWDKTGFDDAHAHIPRGKASRLSKVLLERTKNTIAKPDEMVYAPGKPLLFDSKLNLYKASEVVAAQGDTTLWNEHLKYLFPDQEDRDHVLNWCAWLIQNLVLKPKHALLIAGSTQGTGKTFIAEVLTRILGKANVAPVSEDELSSQFNEWALRAKMILVEELNTIDRNHVAKKLHPIITQERIKINNKNDKRITIDNCFGIFCMTNEDAAIPLKDTDRRYLVVRTKAALREDHGAYGAALYAFLDNAAGIAAVMWELQHRDLGAYSGAGRAPYTAAKAAMVASGLSDLEDWLESEKLNPPFSFDLVCIQDDIMPNVPPRLARGSVSLSRAITSFLTHKLKGYPFPDQHRLKSGRKVRLWALHGKDGILGKMDPRERAALYEAGLSNARHGADAKVAEDFDT